MKINVAVFYGCRSVEHEVSIISAVQAMRSINRQKYDITPVYVDKNGEMFTGEKLFDIENYRNLPELIKTCRKVYFARQGDKVLMKSAERTVVFDAVFVCSTTSTKCFNFKYSSISFLTEPALPATSLAIASSN